MGKVRVGTTPTHIFTVDLDLTGAVVVNLTYMQCGRIVLEKEKDEMTVEPDKVTVELSQEDTLGFDQNMGVEMQFRVRFPNEKAHKSNIMSATADRVLKGGVI